MCRDKQNHLRYPYLSLSELLSWRYQAAKRCGQQDE
ncbi:TPA: GpE family phage tail protein [Proteus mirabilis]|nr:GpE family phage tail protein [Proteus mirabilis]